MKFAGDGVQPLVYQYAIMVELLGKYPELRGMISPEDQFFIEFYKKQYSRIGRRKVLELRRGIIAGTISVDAARAVVSRPDLAPWRIKERQQRQQMASRFAEAMVAWNREGVAEKGGEGIAGENIEGSAHVA